MKKIEFVKVETEVVKIKEVAGVGIYSAKAWMYEDEIHVPQVRMIPDFIANSYNEAVKIANERLFEM